MRLGREHGNLWDVVHFAAHSVVVKDIGVVFQDKAGVVIVRPRQLLLGVPFGEAHGAVGIGHMVHLAHAAGLIPGVSEGGIEAAAAIGQIVVVVCAAGTAGYWPDSIDILAGTQTGEGV